MAATSAPTLFSVNEIVRVRGQVGLISGIVNQLGFNRYTVINIDTGEEMVAFGYELRHCDEVSAALLPPMEVSFEDESEGDAAASMGDQGVQAVHPTGDETKADQQTDRGARWAKISDSELDTIAQNRHSGNTANQTKWAVSVFRGMILT